MFKLIITALLISSTYAYPYEEENKLGPPVVPDLGPEIKHNTPDIANDVPNFDADAAHANVKPEPEGSDLKTDATFWPFYRSYYRPYYRSYYSYPSYRYYTPSIYYHYYW